MAGLQELLRRQRALADFGDFVLDHDDLDEILNEGCRLVAEALGADLAKVVEIERAANKGFVRAGIGWRRGIVGHERVDLSERSSEAFAIEKTEPVITNDVAKETRFAFPRFLIEHGVVALVNVPILLPGRKPFGVLQVDARKPRNFDEADIEFLKTYAMTLGPVIDRLLTAAELRRADERLRLVVENARDYVLVVSDAQDRITDWLGGSATILGWSAEEARGQTSELFFTEEDRAAGIPARELAGAREHGASANVRWHSRKDGSRVFLDGQTIALRSRSGGLQGYLKLAQDATTRKQHEELQMFQLQLADALRPLAGPLEVQAAAARVLGEKLGASRVFYGEVIEDGHTVVVEQAFAAPGHAERTGAYRVSDFGASLVDILRRGTTVELPDIAAAPELGPSERAAFAAHEIGALVAAPLVKDGVLVAGLWVTQDRPRAWSQHELSIVRGTAERTWAAVERARAEAALRESEERLQAAVEVGRLGLWDWDVRSGRIHWSYEHFRMEGYGVGEVTPSYEAWAARIHPEDRPEAEAALQRAMEQREEYIQEFRAVHADGNVRWLYARGRFSYDPEGRPTRMVGAMIDTTDRREWEDTQKVLVAELQHRTRNLMSVVRAMAEKTVRSSADLPSFRKRFRDRLDALARVQGLLSRLHDHDRVTFDELLASEMDAMDAADRADLEGPKGVRLRSSTVQTLAMAIHELATNAVKYGALGQPQAKLSVRWSLEAEGPGGQPWLHIDWRERGVHMPGAGVPAKGTGQGRELIEQALPYQLGAKTTYHLGQDGVHCTIAVPVSASKGAENG